jgi:hypothetical protein
LQEIDYTGRSKSRTEDYEYIIICPDDATFVSYANQLKAFRTKQGIKTGVVTTTQLGGNTQAAIEGYIDNAYNNWDVPPSGVLMMADYGASGSAGTLFCPTWDSYCVSDNFYADVDEADGKGLPEITFARMTAQNEAHLQTMVSKIINYETNPPTASTFYNKPITALGWQTERWFQICSETIGGFMKNVLGKSPVRINAVYEGNPDSDPWSTATNTDQVLAYFGPSGRGYIPSSPTSLGGWTGGNASGVITAINNGAFILQHRDHGAEYGWGEPDFQSPNISSLTNTNNQLPFVFSMNCLTGKYNYSSDCFAELFHRYTYNGSNSGCLGILAATESSYSFVNDAYAWGMYDYFFPSFMPDYGPAATNNDEFLPAFASVSGKIFLDYSSWPYNTENKEVTNYLFHLHGDPFMVVYTDVPQNLAVTHNDIIDGDPVFYVSANAGSVIALVANGEIIGEGIGTGSQQAISIAPQFTSTQVTLTVTKQNYFRYESTFTVQQPTGNSGGLYSQSVNDLDFGNLTLGDVSTKYFSITNSHSSEYITGQITAPAGFTVAAYSKGEGESAGKDAKNSINYTVPANTTRTYSLLFVPSAVASYNGNISITSSDTSHPNMQIALTAAGVVPDVNLNPAGLSATAAPEASANKQFAIENTDIGRLDYSLSVNYTDTKDFKGSGGPDTFGYKWKDSDEIGGPVYNWVEISSIGTVVSLIDEAESSAISMGMTFSFYGTDYTSIYIADNGTLTFNAESVPYTNVTIPNSATANAIISPYWDDLDCGSASSGDVYYYHDTANARFIVEYNSIVNYSNSTTNTFQVLLYENGRIVFQYKTMNGSLTSCTVGIETSAGTVGSLVTYNTAYLKNNFAIQFQATPEWLSLNSTSGTINGTGSSQITATCSAAGLELGVYTAEIIIGSNDPDEATKTLPVTFTVAYNLGGTFGLSSNSISYGTVTVCTDSTRSFTITNSHSEQTISGSITTIAGYTVSEAAKCEVKDIKNVLNYMVGPNCSKNFNLIFEPAAAQNYNGNITVTSSDPAHPLENIAVTGAGAVPEIGLNVASITAGALPEGSAARNFTIENTGAGNLIYSASVNYTSGKDVKASGGPDAYGYKWKDSDETGGPVFSWVEISSLGTAVTLADDGVSGTINMGMTFNFYGTDYTSLIIGDNGGVIFTGTSLTATNAAIPGTAAPNALLAAFWDDLNCASASSGDVYYYYDSANSRFIIEYNAIVDYGTTNTNTFEIIIYASGKIVYQYKQMNGILNECTVGIENAAGSVGSQIVYNAAYLKNNLAIQFQATPEWLTLNKTSGVIAGSAKPSELITATCSAAGLDLGTYTADIIITNNDGDENPVTIPVTFNVSASLPANITLSAASISKTAAPEAAVSDSFGIGNTGEADLNYTITKDYAVKKTDISVHTNDFTSGLGAYTNSGALTWSVSGGQAVLNSTTSTDFGILTSNSFDGTVCTSLNLSFTQAFTTAGLSTAKVEYFNGTGWVEIYSASASTSESQLIALPDIAANMQIRFTGNMRKNSGDSWIIDNIAVSGPEIVVYTWLSITSPLTGTVTPTGNNNISYTCDAAGLSAGTYNANISIASNDPDEPNKVLPVEFVVSAPLTAPANVIVISATTTQVDLGWDTVAGAAIYRIYRSTEPYSGFAQVDTSATNSWQDTNILSGNKYFYYITADNAK